MCACAHVYMYMYIYIMYILCTFLCTYTYLRSLCSTLPIVDLLEIQLATSLSTELYLSKLASFFLSHVIPPTTSTYFQGYFLLLSLPSAHLHARAYVWLVGCLPTSLLIEYISSH